MSDIIAVEISDDGLVAQLTINPDKENGLGDLTEEGLFSYLADQSVLHGRFDTLISETFREAKSSGIGVQNLIIARGSQPKAGRDSSFKFAFEVGSVRSFYELLRHTRLTANIPLHLENQVKVGDVLAIKFKAVPGQAGRKVSGGEIAAPEVEDRELVLGKNVEVKALPYGKRYFSVVDGQVEIEGNRIEVMQVYLIDGDVDLSVGDVDFEGNVYIKGSLSSGFSVRGGGSVVVLNRVDRGHIQSVRDIEVVGDIIGGGQSQLTAGRNMLIKSAENALLRAGRIVSVREMITDCHVQTSEKLLGVDGGGQIVGGLVEVGRKIKVQTVGSEFGVMTRIKLGGDVVTRERVQDLDKSMSSSQASIDRIQEVLNPIIKDRSKLEALSASRKLAVKQALTKLKDLRNYMEFLEKEKSDLADRPTTIPRASLKVYGRLYPPAEVTIGGSKLTLNKRLDKVVLLENAKEKKIEVRPATP